MFSLLVKGRGWADKRDLILAERVFEYTQSELIAQFKPDGTLDFSSLISLPALFVKESDSQESQPARVGTISRAKISGREISLEYAFDPAMPPFSNSQLEGIAAELGIDDDFEFHRMHWAVKDIDLWQALFRNLYPRRPKPRVFQLAEPENIERKLVSVMMPFDASFNAVYESIKSTAEAVGLRPLRADDIWENPAIIQDVVSLIDRAKVVICDCTGRNANVFYEIGIAHTLGREVILIAQSEDDIPFDLRHLRYVKYLNNGEGLTKLSEQLKARLAELT